MLSVSCLYSRFSLMAKSVECFVPPQRWLSASESVGCFVEHFPILPTKCYCGAFFVVVIDRTSYSAMWDSRWELWSEAHTTHLVTTTTTPRLEAAADKSKVWEWSGLSESGRKRTGRRESGWWRTSANRKLKAGCQGMVTTFSHCNLHIVKMFKRFRADVSPPYVVLTVLPFFVLFRVLVYGTISPGFWSGFWS